MNSKNIDQRNKNLCDLGKQIAEQERQLERLSFQITIVENENSTLEEMIQQRQGELGQILETKEEMFEKYQELERKKNGNVQGIPDMTQLEETTPEPHESQVAAAFINYFSKPEESKVPEIANQGVVLSDDIDITNELEKLGLSAVLKKY